MKWNEEWAGAGEAAAGHEVSVPVSPSAKACASGGGGNCSMEGVFPRAEDVWAVHVMVMEAGKCEAVCKRCGVSLSAKSAYPVSGVGSVFSRVVDGKTEFVAERPSTRFLVDCGVDRGLWFPRLVVVVPDFVGGRPMPVCGGFSNGGAQ